MSACPTCKSLTQQMPSRIVVVVDGVTYIQEVKPATKADDIDAAIKYLSDLFVAAVKEEEGQTTHG